MTINQYYLQEMGIEVWLKRSDDSSQKALSELASRVSVCTLCPLHQSRKQAVSGRGYSAAKLMIAGLAPDTEEDNQGIAFAGKTGRLLANMLKSIGLSEEEVYITSIIKCRTPDDRDPSGKEMLQCGAWLAEQIALIQPELLLVLGDIAGQFILKSELSLEQMRATMHFYENIPCKISYHPGNLLTNPENKTKSWADLLQVKEYLAS